MNKGLGWIRSLQESLISLQIEIEDKREELNVSVDECADLRARLDEALVFEEGIEMPPPEEIRFFGEIVAHARNKRSIVRDPAEKLRFSDQEFEVLILVPDLDNSVFGCQDFVPCGDSEVMLVGEYN